MTTTIKASAANGLVSTADGSGILDVGADNTVTFSTASTERGRFDSSGSLLVGTTSTIGTNTKGVQLSQDGTGGYMRIGTTINTSYTIMGFYNQSNYAGSVSLLNNSTSYGTSSDYRLKKEVQPMTNGIATVSQLKPVIYKWKSDDSNGQGFIAHELQEIVPDAVIGEKDAVDENGNPKYQHIDTSFLVATLTAAIQEQQAIIEQLKADVATLKGQA